MGIFRSTDPTTFDDVDQIVINESAPPAEISQIATNIALLIARFQRGPSDRAVEVSSVAQFEELYGASSYSGNLELKSKKFGRLRLIRVIATDAAKATRTFNSGATPTIKFDAKYEGDYGNNIEVDIAAGSVSGKKYTIKDKNEGTVLPDEVYDNVEIASVDDQTFLGSKMVDVSVLDTAGEPDNDTQDLAGGDDGTEADADYDDGLELAAPDGIANILWTDKYSTTIKNSLELHVSNNPNKIAIIAPDSSAVTKSAAITEVASYRSDRLVYAYPYVTTLINGVETEQSPASWYASIVSQLGPQEDPATVDAVEATVGMTGLKDSLGRADYINFKDGGISAFEFDSDFGFKIKSGITTSLQPGLTQVLRRRMSDFLTNSIGRFLKTYQNKVNDRRSRDLVKSQITNLVKTLENEGILPTEADLPEGGGKTFLVDTDTLNTADSLAQGFFKILYRQRIFSSMRFIVLQAEIGQGVIVTEQT